MWRFFLCVCFFVFFFFLFFLFFFFFFFFFFFAIVFSLLLLFCSPEKTMLREGGLYFEYHCLCFSCFLNIHICLCLTLLVYGQAHCV